jgi:hypothetical protein
LAPEELTRIELDRREQIGEPAKLESLEQGHIGEDLLRR